MKKKFRIITVLLSLLLAFSFVLTSCDKDEKEETEETSLFTTGIHGGDATETDNFIVKNGKSDYVLVLADDAAQNTVKGQQTFSNFFTEATKITLPVVRDSQVTWSSDLKAISFGYNDLTEANGLKNENESKTTNSYQIKTVGNTIFVLASELGVIYGAQELLNRWFNFEYFAEYCYSLDTGVQEVKLCNYNISEVPDIYHMNAYILGVTKTTSDSYYMNGLRMDNSSYSGWGGSVHNSIYYVPYDSSYVVNASSQSKLEFPDPKEGYGSTHRDWYSEGTGGYKTGVPNQLCYSKQDEWLPLVYDKFKVLVENNPDEYQFGFIFEDSPSMCTCENCKAAKKNYGTDAGLYFMACSKVAKFINEWVHSDEAKAKGIVDREIFVVALAYHATYEAPTKYNEETKKYELIAPECAVDPHVVNIYCTRSAIRMESLNSKNNASYRDNMYAWGTICSTMGLWKYNQAWYGENLQYNGYFTCMQQDYQFAAYNNVRLMMDEGQGSISYLNHSAFQILRGYLASNLAWNCNYDYEAMITRFFNTFFGPASEEWRIIFDALESNLNQKYYDGIIGGEDYALMKTSIYTQGFLETLISLYEDSLEKIAYLKDENYSLYSKYEKRITAESLSLRYMYIELYAKSIDADKLLSMRLQYKKDTVRVKIMQGGYTKNKGHDTSLSIMWTRWGIA